MRPILLFFLLLLGPALSAQTFTPTSDGLYAVFTVSLRQSNQQFATKEFAVQLHYQEAPITVANFVGLAEGTYDWFDFDAFTIRSNTPYFNGSQFHRIVENFIIQAGTPKGELGDGPGWTIPDEIVPELKHEGGGVLSMANSSASGNLNSGGSQFFITMVPFPGEERHLATLDGRHAVFGQVVEGLSVAQEIGRVPLVGSAPHPDWPVTIESVAILRRGASAQAFTPTDYWQPPTFRGGNLQTAITQNDHDDDPATAPLRYLEWSFFRERNNHYYIQDSNDLAEWRMAHNMQRAVSTLDLVVNRDIRADIVADNRHFYRMVELDYPPLPELPFQGTAGTNLTLRLNPADVDPDSVIYLPESLRFSLLDNFRGFWELERSDSDAIKPIGMIESYQWWNLGSRFQVSLNLNGFTSLQAYLTPTSASSGAAYVHYLSSRPEGVNVTGSYTLSPENEARTPLDMDGLKLTFTLEDTDLQGETFTTDFTVDFWDQLEGQDADDDPLYEGGWHVTASSSDFINVGWLLYHWFEEDGKVQLLLDFDNITDIHVQMDAPVANSGTATAYFSTGSRIDTVSYTKGIGDNRPSIIDKNLTRLTLNITIDTEISNKLVVDFWDNSQGSYQSTRTDQEVPINGNLNFYQWFESNQETRLELVFDGGIRDRRVFLTPATGAAKVQILDTGAVYNATYTSGAGDPRP